MKIYLKSIMKNKKRGRDYTPFLYCNVRNKITKIMYETLYNMPIVLCTQQLYTITIARETNQQEDKEMRICKITAANKKHFESLIKDYREDGFMLITLGKKFAELENESSLVVIEY